MTYMYDVINYLEEIKSMLDKETNEKCKLRITYDKEYFETLGNADWEISFSYELCSNVNGNIVLTLSVSNSIELQKLLDMCVVCSIVLIRIYELKDDVDDPIKVVADIIDNNMQSKDMGFFETVINHEEFMYLKYRVFKILELHEIPNDDSLSDEISS